MSEPTDPEPSPNVPGSNTAFLSLDDVSDAIEEAFESEHERRWAKEAWAALITNGLASYSNELERCKAAINFVAFAGFYKDWQENAVEGNRGFGYGGLPAVLRLSGFRLGQLVGHDSDFLDDPDFDPHDRLNIEDKLFRNALFRLELRARPEVVAALQGHYGGISGFFVTLWNSDKQPRPPDYERKGEEYERERAWRIENLHEWVPEYQETDYEILNDATGDKMDLWNWLEQGAQPLDRC